MINIHQAIFALNPNIVTIRDDTAYDANEKEVSYSLQEAQVKLIEMQEAETVAQKTALAKLTALGLTVADLTALGIK